MTTVTVRTLTDVRECARVARLTQGMEGDSISLSTWRKWLRAEHSMIRVFILAVEIRNMPYYVSVHLVRHKIGVEHFVRSQRPTSMNPVGYDRREAPQGALVDHTMVLNPQALINISRKRLCNKTDVVTQNIWRQVHQTIARHNNPFVAMIATVMLPDCEYRGGTCHELNPCGKRKSNEEQI